MKTMKTIIQLTILLFLTTACNEDSSGQDEIQHLESTYKPEFLQVDNGVIKVKVDLTRGGAISYLSNSGSINSLINIYDEGRYVQQSYYAGSGVDRSSDGQSPSWSPWPWNPIQVGDAFGNRAQILDYKKDGNEIYVKCVPMLWDMNNEPAQAEIEQWITLDGNVLNVRNKLTCFRTGTTYGEDILRDQELPAVYPISELKNLYCYDGTSPFTNDLVSNLPTVNLSSGFWGRYSDISEHWMAFVDDDGNGLGVYNPTCNSFLAGMTGTPGSQAHDPSTSYIAPIKQETLEANTVYDYNYYIILGTVNEIRSKIYELN